MRGDVLEFERGVADFQDAISPEQRLAFGDDIDPSPSVR